MRILFCLVFSVVILPTSLFGQDAKPFVGTWVMEGAAAKKLGCQHYRLTLAFQGDKLSVAKDFDCANKKTKYDYVLYLDNRGEKNIMPGPDSGREVASKTRWKKGAIRREYSSENVSGRIRLFESTTEKFASSEDSKSLTLVVSTTKKFESGGFRHDTIVYPNHSMKLVFQKE